MILVSRVLQKKKPTRERQFPHIFAVVYFSYRVGSRDEGVPFWVGGDIDPKGDARMREFQERLRHGWFSYIGQVTGLPVKEVLKPIE
jgi:hypothetical protein